MSTIVEKILKLEALAASSDSPESVSASRTAARLRIAHRITDDDLRRARGCREVDVALEMPGWGSGWRAATATDLGRIVGVSVRLFGRGETSVVRLSGPGAGVAALRRWLSFVEEHVPQLETIAAEQVDYMPDVPVSTTVVSFWAGVTRHLVAVLGRSRSSEDAPPPEAGILSKVVRRGREAGGAVGESGGARVLGRVRPRATRLDDQWVALGVRVARATVYVDGSGELSYLGFCQF